MLIFIYFVNTGNLRVARLTGASIQERCCMRLNELPLLEGDLQQIISSHGIAYPIVFLDLGGNCRYTWRGPDQDLPKHATFLFVGLVLCDIAGKPVAVHLLHNNSRELWHMQRLWDKPDLFGHHELLIHGYPPAGDNLWFKHLDKPLCV